MKPLSFFWQAGPDTSGDAPLPTSGLPDETGEASDRYGDVPLGVESAWPMATLPVTV
jgi:hypothetical protein